MYVLLPVSDFWERSYIDFCDNPDKTVATDEESTVAGLPTPYRDDEEAVSLLDNELPGRRGIKKPKKNCCMCCVME